MSNMLNDFDDGQLKHPKPKSKKSRSKVSEGSVRKGKNGERNIANWLSSLTGMNFIRTPSSGSYVGGKNRRRILEMTEGQVNVALGDIICPDDLLINKIIIESKWYKSFPWKKLEKGQVPAKLAEWIEEINYDTVSYLQVKERKEVYGLLWFKINNQGDWVSYNEKYYRHFDCKPEYAVTYDPNPELEEIGYNNVFCIEPAKDFIARNKALLFLPIDAH